MSNIKIAIFKTLKKRSYQVYLLLLFTFLALFAILFIFKKPLTLLPKLDQVQISSFNDSIDKGNSVVKNFEIQDSRISIEYILKEGFFKPYIGIDFRQGEKGFDLSDYDQLEIVFEKSDADNYILFVITEDSNVKNKKHRLAGRHSGLPIKILNQNKTVKVDLNQLETPNWWFEVIGQSPTDFEEVQLNKVKFFTFVTGITPKLDVPQTVVIKSIKFTKNYFFIVSCLLAIELLLFVVFVFIEWKKIRSQKNKPLEVQYKAVQVIGQSDDSTELVFDYIHSNYQDSELSLTKVSESTLVSERSISKIILEKYHCNFKSYINRIRIEEAKRLLLNSDFNISEIAYQVGYKSPSTFNKIFKNITGKTPKEHSQG